MAFNLELVTAAEFTAALVLQAKPSMRLVKSLDSRLRAMTPWLPWHDVDFGSGVVDVLGMEFLDLVFSDEIVLSEELCPDDSPLAWPTIRPLPCSVTKAMAMATTAPLAMLVMPYETRVDFLSAFRMACSSLASWPSYCQADLECTSITDFTDPAFQPGVHAQWIERIAVQSLRQPLTQRTKGWGLLLFTAHPCWEPRDRFGGMTALVSLSSRWHLRIQQDQFHGSTPALRVEAFCNEAVQVLFRAVDKVDFLRARVSSVEREREFVSLMNLGSPEDAVSRAAFREKLVDIIAASPHGDPCRQLMGRTVAGARALELYLRLSNAFLPGQTDDKSLTFSGFERLNLELAGPRLAFLTLPEGRAMDDEARVLGVTQFKEAHSVPSLLVASGTGAASGALQGDQVTHMSGRARAERLERLHLTVRHQQAVAEIEEVLRTPGCSKLDVMEVVFKQAIPSLNRHLLGVETLTGLPVYDQLLVFQCTKQGSESEKEKAVGLFMGQILLRRDDGTVEPEYQGKVLSESVVQKFLKAQLSSIPMEKSILDWVAAVRGCATLGAVSDDKRYLDYVNVDRMLDQISPLFEAFGLGGRTSVDSWASLLTEVKAVLLSVDGLAEIDRHDVIHGQDGLKACITAALDAASNTIRTLFNAKDPLVEVPAGRLFSEDDTYFKHLLSLVMVDIEAKKK